MKKHIVRYLSILVAMITLLSCIPASASKAKWYPSDDGEFEAQIVSIEASTAQDYVITIRIRLIEENKSADVKWTIPYSIVEDEIKQLVSENPSYKNKRMTLTAEEIEKVTYNDGTYYSIIIPLMIGRKNAFVNGPSVRVDLNLAEEFPDDCVDKNILYAVNACKLVEKEVKAIHGPVYGYSLAGPVYVKESTKFKGIMYILSRATYTIYDSYYGKLDYDMWYVTLYNEKNEKYEHFDMFYDLPAGEFQTVSQSRGYYITDDELATMGMPTKDEIDKELKVELPNIFENGAKISAEKVMAQE